MSYFHISTHVVVHGSDFNRGTKTPKTFLSFCNYSVLEVWKVGRRCNWRQTTDNQRETNLRSLQRPQWVLACFAGESLCQVWKWKYILKHRCVLLAWASSSFCKSNVPSARARVCGSYTDMTAGTPAEAMMDFTGGVHVCIQLSRPPANFWMLMCRAGQSKSLMGCGTPQGVNVLYFFQLFYLRRKSGRPLISK